MAKTDEQILIEGPRYGERIQISRGDFKGSHYEEEGYTEVGPVEEDDPDAPKDVPMEDPSA